jgi:cation/acetate symporter
MAAAADWMSAASFISLSGALYLQGFSGTGAARRPGLCAGLDGRVLPGRHADCAASAGHEALHRAGFLPGALGGRWPRIIAALAAITCSFTYVVAQIYGVGLIASRLTGVQFEIGIMLGLGGVLLCSFLGGMRAITWTQVAQYVVILLAFLMPVSWLAYKQLGNPVAPLAYTAQLGKIAPGAAAAGLEAEQEVLEAYRRAPRCCRPSWRMCPMCWRPSARRWRAHPRAAHQQRQYGAIMAASRELAAMPRDEAAARERWTRELQEARARQAAGRHAAAQPAFAGDPMARRPSAGL